jgi:hypothetical protein
MEAPGFAAPYARQCPTLRKHKNRSSNLDK